MALRAIARGRDFLDQIRVPAIHSLSTSCSGSGLFARNAGTRFHDHVSSSKLLRGHLNGISILDNQCKVSEIFSLFASSGLSLNVYTMSTLIDKQPEIGSSKENDPDLNYKKNIKASSKECDQAVEDSVIVKSKQQKKFQRRDQFIQTFWAKLLGKCPTLRAVASLSMEDWGIKARHRNHEFVSTMQHYWLGLKLLWSKEKKMKGKQEQLSLTSRALAVAASLNPVFWERKKFFQLINKEVELYNSMLEKEGTGGGEGAQKAYKATRQSRDDSGQFLEDPVSAALQNMIRALLQQLEKKIDVAKIGDHRILLDIDLDGYSTAEEATVAAMYLKDTLDTEGVQELICNLSKDKDGKILLDGIIELGFLADANIGIGGDFFSTCIDFAGDWFPNIDFS